MSVMRLHPLEIGGPALRVREAQFVEVGKGIDSRRMTIAEAWAEAVVAHRSQGGDGHLGLAEFQPGLARTVTLNFGGGRIDSEVLEGKVKPALILEQDFKRTGGLMQGDFEGIRAVVHGGSEYVAAEIDVPSEIVQLGIHIGAIDRQYLSPAHRGVEGDGLEQAF